MEVLALEDSSLAGDDTLLAEVRRELEIEEEWMAEGAKKCSTAVLQDDLHYDSSDTEDAEITIHSANATADSVKRHLSGAVVNCTTDQQCSRRKRSPKRTKRRKIKKSYCCEICSQHFSHHKSLGAHKRVVHGTEVASVDRLRTCNQNRLPKMPDAVVNSCYSLRVRSSRKKVSDRYEKLEKPHECDVCHRRFKISRDLKLHSRIHSGEKPHVCDDCGKEFTTISQLRSHTRTHTQVRDYECSQCAEKFVWLKSLKRHMRTHEVETESKSCSVCSESFDTPSEMKCHMSAAHGLEHSLLSFSSDKKVKGRWSDTRSECKVCGKSVVDMRKHMLTHSGEKRHQCILCGSCFGIAGTLTVHMRSHTGEKPFGCEDCGKRFTTRSHLTVHRRKHTREEPYECSLCSERFVWLNSLKRHLQLHKEMDNQMYSVRGGEADQRGGADDMSKNCTPSGSVFKKKMLSELSADRSHVCSYCGRYFTTAMSLRTHIRTHTTEKKFVCAECGSRFHHMSHLRVHMRIHSDELRYECSICAEKFLWQNSLKRHLWKHGIGREPTHACPVCGKLFLTPYQLRIHSQSHSGEKPHMCHQCGRRYTSRGSLRCHQRYSHSTQPRLPCPECGKLFKSARVVRQHLRAAHQGTVHRCADCGLEFREHGWLAWHVLSHSSEPYMCDECKQCCNSAPNTTGCDAVSLSAEHTRALQSQHPCHTGDSGPGCVVNEDLDRNVSSFVGSVIPARRDQSCVTRDIVTAETSAAAATDVVSRFGVATGDFPDYNVSITNTSVSMSASSFSDTFATAEGCFLPGDTAAAISSRVEFDTTLPSGCANKSSGVEISSLPASNNAASFDLFLDSPFIMASDAVGVVTRRGIDRTADNCSAVSDVPVFGRRTAYSVGTASVLYENEVAGTGQWGVGLGESGCVITTANAGHLSNTVDPARTTAEFNVGTIVDERTALSHVEGVGTGSDTTANAKDSTTASAAASGVANSDDRCVRCHRVRPAQRCPVCRRAFTSLATHIGVHSGKNPYSISSLLGIETSCEDDGSERLDLADGKGELMLLQRKRKRMRRRVPQQCTVCGRTYTKLAQHMARMHGTGEPSMCPDCGKFLRNAATLRTHMASRTCLKSLVCPICDRTCENDAGLKSHMRSHAAVDRDGSGLSAEGSKTQCSECSHTFSTVDALETHMALHRAGKHHVCSVCGRTFIHASSLRLHLRFHTGETPFECRVCGKTFRSRKGLSEHRTVHTMEKRYACQVCGRRFRLRRTFARHMVIHSGVKRFKCPECGMMFAFNHLRTRHMRTHSGEKPYLCGDCGDRFTQWNGLYQHRRRRCGKLPAPPQWHGQNFRLEGAVGSDMGKHDGVGANF